MNYDGKVVYDDGIVVVTLFPSGRDHVCISLPILGDEVYLTLDELSEITQAVAEALEAHPEHPVEDGWAE